MNRSDAIIVRFEPERGPPERRRYEPCDDGRWIRVTEWHNGCRWVGRGAEVVADVAIER